MSSGWPTGNGGGADWSSGPPLEQRFGALSMQPQPQASSSQPPSQASQLPSPVKNYSAFGGGMFFQPDAPRSQQQHQHQHQQQQQQFSSSAFDQTSLFGPPSSSSLSRAAFDQPQPRPPLQTLSQPLHREAQYFTNGPPVQASQAPHMSSNSAHFPAPSTFHPPPPGHAFPSPQQQQQQTVLPPPQQQIRPPMMNRPSGAPGAIGPPGFKAPPGFPGQQQPQPQAPLGSSGMPPPSYAPSLPSTLQHDTHVQCSLCRVIVVNNPQALYMHDTSPQHLENERRQHMMRQQPQSQPQLLPHQPPPVQQRPPMGGPSIPEPFGSAAGSSSSQTAPGPGQPPIAPSASGNVDLNALQAQLRAFMLQSEQAKATGAPVPQMDAHLMGQLKAMQETMHRNGNAPASASPSPNLPLPGGEEQRAGPSSAAAGGKQLPPGSVPSTAGPFPSREALIVASSAIHYLPSRRATFKRNGPNAPPPIHAPPSLEHDLRVLLATLQPDPTTFAVREEIRAACEALVQKAWGADVCEVKLFGSSVNTLCETNSDVDLCLSIRDIDTFTLDKPRIVEKLGQLFAPHFNDILILPKARVPIVKFKAQPASFASSASAASSALAASTSASSKVLNTTLDCDIGINNHLACENSLLIRDYMNLDPRVRDLCLVIKYWARRRKINDPYRGTLSSYCYVMMVINFLQQCAPAPVLPCLQQYKREEASPEEIAAKRIDGFDCWYFKDIDQLRGFGARNTLSLGELLIGFFRLYSHDFTFKDTVVSVRTANYLDKQKKVWAESGKKDRQLLCVEDPFDVTHNLARGCDATALYEIRGELQRAYRMLTVEKATIADICAPYAKEWRGA